MGKRCIFGVLIGLLVGLASVQALEWERVAYWDTRVPTAWQGGGTAVRDGLAAAGYTILDADQLKTWMDARIADKKLSVVVFCRDIVPSTVAETMSAACTLRRYLDAGGKIVWYADIPFYYQGTTAGGQTTWGDAGSAAILGFNAAAAPRDSNRTVTLTSEGRSWGLTQTWGSVRPSLVANIDRKLADDGAGHAAAWVKHYVAGDTYRGFIRIWDRSGEPSAADVRRVAEFLPLKAINPQPGDGARVEALIAVLQWDAGLLAAEHRVYFGANATDVANGAGGTDKGLQAANTYFALGLTQGTTYYWRIDEVNDTHPDSPWTGDVWSFTVASTKATSPTPSNGAVNVVKNSPLSWEPGLGALASYVFMGTSPTNLVQKTATGGTAYTPTGQADGTTYYWRIDSTDGINIVTGDVWSYTTIPFIPVTDPNLKVWFTFDEDTGLTALDWSGHGNHGTLHGDPQWVLEAVDGGGIDLDGSGDYVRTNATPSALGIGGNRNRTAAGWVYLRAFNNGALWDCGNRADGQNFCLRTLGASPQWRVQYWGSADSDFSYNTLNDWHHFAQVHENGQTTIYIDAMVVNQHTPSPVLNTLDTITWRVGAYGDVETTLNAMMDDVRLYDKALDQAGVALVMRGNPNRAYGPTPANGQTVSIDLARQMSWSKGDAAVQHDVYFGTDAAMVEAADVGEPGVYKGRQAAATYNPAVVMGMTYYWRIDEVNNDSSITKGRVWRFTVANYLIVDD
ncbi:MAG TPA: LamG domain-containing protein, partial [Phycisphaerales bacterium]|nr:LamG domain-containing protein [Phycisphaerales bacterium]